MDGTASLLPSRLKTAMKITGIGAGVLSLGLLAFEAFLHPGELLAAYDGVGSTPWFVETAVIAGACGIVGWLTNWIAIHLLFHPHQPTWLVPGSKNQFGVFPRQKNNIAKSVGEMLHERLLTEDRLREYIQSPEIRKKVESFVEDGLRSLLRPEEPYPSLRRILEVEFGLTHEVYERREQLLDSLFKYVSDWLAEPDRRADIEMFLLSVLSGLRGKTAEELLGPDGMKAVESAGDRLTDSFLDRVEEYLDMLLDGMPEDRSIREWLGPDGVKAVHRALDGLAPVLLSHAADLLRDEEFFDWLVDTLRRNIKAAISAWKRKAGWLKKLAFKFGNWILNIDGELQNLHDHLEPMMKNVRDEMQKPKVRSLVQRKIREMVDSFMDLQPGELARRFEGDGWGELKSAAVSVLQSEEVHAAITDFWHRWLAFLSKKKLDAWLPDVDTRSLEQRQAAETLAAASNLEDRLAVARDILRAAVEDAIAAIASDHMAQKSLKMSRRLLTDEAFTVVLDCNDEEWNGFVAAQTATAAAPEIVAMEHVPGRGTPESSDGLGNVAREGEPMEWHGSMTGLQNCDRRIQVVWIHANLYSKDDIDAACEMVVRVSGDAADKGPTMPLSEDGYGVFVKAVVTNIDGVTGVVETAVASWDRMRELGRLARRLSELASTAGDCGPALDRIAWSTELAVKVSERKRITIAPKPGLGFIGSLVDVVQALLSSENTRSMLNRAVREYLDKVMNTPIGFPVDRIGEGSVAWIERAMPAWVIVLLQRHAHRIAGALDFRDTARKAIEETDMDQVEAVVKDQLAGPAFNWLEVLGGVLGLIMGVLLQFAMPLYTLALELMTR